jgi:Ca-activated chloride channel family protein
MFNNPYILFLLLLLIPIVVWYILRHKKLDAHIRISTIQPFIGIPRSKKLYLIHVPFVLRILALALVIVALARPQFTNRWHNETTEGIDIMLALDISGSMLAEDFRPNRLEAAKSVATEFIAGRPNDRIGLVLFSAESFTQCPLTSDKAVLINLLNSVKSGMIEDGTAIGLGLANAVSRIKDSEAKSKVIILVTDGVNNTGDIAPITAAEIAQTFGVRVYTIGVGTIGKAPYPFQTPLGIQYQNIDVEIDEPILQQIADMTDGHYFRATNNNKLKAIYQEIDSMEKTKTSVREFNKKSEAYLPFALVAFLLFLTEIIFRNTILKKIP